MRPFSRRSVMGVIAVGAIGVAAACGGDDNGDGGVSLEEYVSQADAICAEFDPQFAAIEEPASADEVRPFLVENLELGQQQTAELEALEVPEEVADLEAQARANNAEAVELLETAIQRIDDGDDVGQVVEDINAESPRIEGENRAIAQEIGLQVCGADDEAEAAPSDEPTGTTTDDATTETQPDDPDVGTAPSDSETVESQPSEPESSEPDPALPDPDEPQPSQQPVPEEDSGESE